MKTTHTPGPWTQSKRNEADVYSENGERIASAHGPRCADNAHLIAAAPDLLAALESAQEYMLGSIEFDDRTAEEQIIIDGINAAINKAKGAQ